MASKDEQVAIAERLQLKWLTRMEKLLDEGDITSTDMATLVRFLTHNGWTLDPTRLPQGLRDKLTSGMKPEDFENDGDVIPLRRKG
jgi:hypothetical protein